MFEETSNSSEYSIFPGNQEQYRGQLIPRSNSDILQSSLDSTGLDLTVSCKNCEEFQEIKIDSLLRVKTCTACSKEYVCNEICHKVTPGQFNYEYLTCDKRVIKVVSKHQSISKKRLYRKKSTANKARDELRSYFFHKVCRHFIVW